MHKEISLKIKGMQRDLSTSAFNPEYAYENMNMRIMPTNENTLLSLVNEKGNELVNIIGLERIYGTPIGQSTIDNELILFTAGDKGGEDKDLNIIGDDLNIVDDGDHTKDRIYKIWIEDNEVHGKLLFKGDLNFNPKYPIETVSLYENEDIKKVYWTDGINSPRVINTSSPNKIIKTWDNNSFDFIPKLKLEEKINIYKNIIANGEFASGVIQYAFTYFNKYSQESNIFYISPLYYISYSKRGGSPEDKIGNSFTIVVDNIEKKFDYIRIYSIHRTSINATPVVKKVVDISTPKNHTLYLLKNWLKPYVNPEKIMVFNTVLNKYVALSSIPHQEILNAKSWKLPGSTYSSLKYPDSDYVEILPNKTLYIYSPKTGSTLIKYTDRTPMSVYLYTKGKIEYTDNGLSGEFIDPTVLFYIGGEEVIFSTISHKDNTLFAGDITLKRKIINEDIRSFFRKVNISFSNGFNNPATIGAARTLKPPKPEGYYPYNSQLHLSSNDIKVFKYLETYRLGLQFQHVTGKWSEPIWLNDVKNTVPVQSNYINDTYIYLPSAEYNLDNKDIINKLINLGYVKVRPVVVYPTLTDRDCICQGVLCPTVFNVGDRYGNSPFSQSSWFFRPNLPFDIRRSYANNGEWWDRDKGPSIPFTLNSRSGTLLNLKKRMSGVKQSMDPSNMGVWSEFRHLYPIPSNNQRNAEIQCIHNPPERPTVPTITFTQDIISSWVSQNSENFYVDQSILTFHSPDIEFDDNIKSIDTSNLQLRIIGMVPLTSFIGDINIQTSTPALNYKDSADKAIGFYKEPVGVHNISRFGCRNLSSGVFWLDEFYGYTDSYENVNKKPVGFVVYPWHRNGSLNNQKSPKDGYRSAMLDKKKISNTRYSYNTYYLKYNEIYDFNEGGTTRQGISGVSIFDSNEVSLIKIPSPKGSKLADIVYYGNIDKVITYPSIGDKKDGYPINYSGIGTAENHLHWLFSGGFHPVQNLFQGNHTGIDPVRMKYKSTPHAVIALNYTTDNKQVILPTIHDGNIINNENHIWEVNKIQESFTGETVFWDTNKISKGIYQDVLNIYLKKLNGSYNGYGIEYGFLWLGELYNPNVVNRFGGQTEEAFENNQWLPCGFPVSLIKPSNRDLKEGEDNENKDSINDRITIRWIEGDTYYQRYDHLKTYPFTLEDQNSVTDVLSFMVETRVNLDGRYDKNRGQISNLVTTPNNFNKINEVYNQQDNFFVYRGLNLNKINLDNFRNTVTWTKTKTLGELIDTWTNITLVSTLDLDGDKGNVRAIRRLNNNLIAFQDKGISQIIYNENTQISTTEGIPVEIANSGKVTGKRYLSDSIGCINKWSICEATNGLYFIDDITKSIYLFNGKLDNISDRLGFHSWINNNLKTIHIWNPVDFKGFVTYYDKVNKDVLFINDRTCLAFSEPLMQFTSFYSYDGTPYFANIRDIGISVRRGKDTPMYDYKLWKQNKGKYNMFFGKYHPFSTTIIANPETNKDKTFDTIDFKSDSYKLGTFLINDTFDNLTVWNEYQYNQVPLVFSKGSPSNLKKKFRIWRATIPRDTNSRNRIRNPWVFIKLSREKENTNKTILHDMTVHYFD